MFVYTVWLKRRTPQNIVIGGAAGAVPPLVGWAAVTGRAQRHRRVLFAIVFYWTPPHFWALSLLMKDEYAKVGVPMMPVVRGEDETRRQILLYSVLLYAVTQLPFCAGGFGAIYLVVSMALGLGFIAGAVRLYRRADRALGAAPLPLLARLPRAAVRRDGRSTHTRVGFGAHGPPARTQEPPHRLMLAAFSLFMFGITFVVAADLPRVSDDLDTESPPAGEQIHLPAPVAAAPDPGRRLDACTGRRHGQHHPHRRRPGDLDPGARALDPLGARGHGGPPARALTATARRTPLCLASIAPSQ